MQRPLFDAVLFDLDGTLIATDRFWVQAARTGARRAFTELGLERELPGAEAWMDIVGQPLTRGFERLFPDLDAADRARVQAACVEEEARALAAGQACLMPGTERLLQALHDEGVALGIASNCGRGYLAHMLSALGLERWIDAARCIDSPGVESKADMVADLLLAFGTRSAVMVGDRASDRDAAWSNGLPHVHCAFGFAARHEDVAAEARIEDLGELVGVLAGRRAWIRGALEDAGFLRPPGGRPRALGVTGRRGAGATLFARDAARVLAAEGRPSAVLSLEALAAPGELERAPAATAPLVAALVERVLEPHAEGAAFSLELPGRAPLVIAPGTTLLVEGPWLLHPRLRTRLERLFYLAAPAELLLRRASGRAGRDFTAEDLERRRALLAAEEAFEAEHPPGELSDALLAADRPFGPPRRA